MRLTLTRKSRAKSQSEISISTHINKSINKSKSIARCQDTIEYLSLHLCLCQYKLLSRHIVFALSKEKIYEKTLMKILIGRNKRKTKQETKIQIRFEVDKRGKKIKT